MKKIVYILLLISGNVFSQQLPHYSLYHMNRFVQNPAIAGAYGDTKINFMARNQWLGFKGAPSTYLVTAEGRFLKKGLSIGTNLFGIKKLKKREKGNMGIGGIVYSDHNGHFTHTGAKFSYGYHIKMDYSQLSFGLATHFFQVNLKKDDLKPLYNEPMLNSNNKSGMGIDATIGVNYVVRDKLYLGVATDEVLQTLNLGKDISSDYKVYRMYYVNIIYRFELNSDYSLEPLAYIRINEKFRNNSDIQLTLNYRNDYWAGITYRTMGDMVLLAGVNIDNLSIGYSFDYSLYKVMTYSYGSHEFMVGLRIGDSERRYRWKSRYF